MSVKVNIKVDAESMADFMIYHIYTSKAGFFALVLGVLNIGFTIAFFRKGEVLLMYLFALFALLILVVFPYFIRKKVRKQMQNSNRLGEEVTYEFMEDGIITTTKDDSGKASWGKFKRAVARKSVLFLYDSQRRAIVLPIGQLGEQYKDIVELIYAHMPAPAVRIRRMGKKK